MPPVGSAGGIFLEIERGSHYMFQTENIPGENYKKQVAYFIVVSLLLYITSLHNYLLAHFLMEGWTIVVGTVIYILATKTYSFSEDSFFLFLGYAYLAVACLDTFHTLSYKGLGVFPQFTANQPTQFWIAARYVEAVSLFIAPLFAGKKVSKKMLAGTYAALIAFLIPSIAYYGFFPDCYLEGYGLTQFKIVSEYVICGILIAAILHIRKQKDKGTYYVTKTVRAAIILTIMSELAFTLYTDVYGVMNFTGHILKIASYYCIYIGVITEGLERPYRSIFEKVHSLTIRDPLTNLYNRLGFHEFAAKINSRARRDQGSIGILMIDFDNFKMVNDLYGHAHGDEVLVEFAEILLDTIRGSDIAGRIGGDEFAVILPDVEQQSIDRIKDRIYMEFKERIKEGQYSWFIDISIGSTLQVFEDGGSPSNTDEMLHIADMRMYEQKRANKKAFPHKEDKS